MITKLNFTDRTIKMRDGLLEVEEVPAPETEEPKEEKEEENTQEIWQN